MKDGVMQYMPVAECPGGCAVNGFCADEYTCNVSKIGMIIGLSIFGCFCCVGISCFCIAGCAGVASSSSSSNDINEPLLEEKKEDVEMNLVNNDQTPMGNQYQYNNQMAPNSQY